MRKRIGKGSIFRFTITLPGAARPLWPAVNPKSICAGLRVLAVDDNATYREILHSQLTSWGFDVVTAADAEQAIVELRKACEPKQPFRIAAVDFVLPGSTECNWASPSRPTRRCGKRGRRRLRPWNKRSTPSR